MTEEKIELPKVEPLYSFDWICSALGLIPICDGEAAINLVSIVDFVRQEDGPGWILNLEHGESFNLDPEDMAELQAILRNRIEEQKLQQAENFERQKSQQAEIAKAQIRAQAEAVAELNQGVQPGMIVGAPTGKGWRKH
jgi:hypothetical protein